MVHRYMCTTTVTKGVTSKRSLAPPPTQPSLSDTCPYHLSSHTPKVSLIILLLVIYPPYQLIATFLSQISLVLTFVQSVHIEMMCYLSEGIRVGKGVTSSLGIRGVGQNFERTLFM